jgi:hypothetical protein
MSTDLPGNNGMLLVCSGRDCSVQSCPGLCCLWVGIVRLGRAGTCGHGVLAVMMGIHMLS